MRKVRTEEHRGFDPNESFLSEGWISNRQGEVLKFLDPGFLVVRILITWVGLSWHLKDKGYRPIPKARIWQFGGSIRADSYLQAANFSPQKASSPKSLGPGLSVLPSLAPRIGCGSRERRKRVRWTKQKGMRGGRLRQIRLFLSRSQYSNQY